MTDIELHFVRALRIIWKRTRTSACRALLHVVWLGLPRTSWITHRLHVLWIHRLRPGYVAPRGRGWAGAAPHAFVVGPRSMKKVTVWCAVGYSGIVGPYLFEDNEGNTVTVNSQRYVSMLHDKFIPDLQQMPQVNMHTVRFQQDGAPPHTANLSLAALAEWCPGDRLISRRTNNIWPAYSPEMTPPDFWLWGYLKSMVYANNPQTLEVLKNNITMEIESIPLDMIHRVMDNFMIRVRAVVDQDGNWIEHVIRY